LNAARNSGSRAICNRKRGGRKLVLVPGGAETVPERIRVDNAMIKALARAFRWRKLLKTGAYRRAAVESRL
jgi:hypothetical protein